jgi:phosphate transport system protein
MAFRLSRHRDDESPGPVAVAPTPVRATAAGTDAGAPPRFGVDPAEVAPPAELLVDRAGPLDLDELDRLFTQLFALVGEAIAGATHALLAGDREAAKQLVQRDDVVDALTHRIADEAQRRLVSGAASIEERRVLVAVLRMVPDLERNGDLAEHIARRGARGLGSEMSARSRGLVERMGEVAATIWSSTADAFAERSLDGARHVEDLDDEMDELHVTLTAELVSGAMPVPVAIELAMVARFYERFGDHAVNLARRMAALVGGSPEPGGSGAD